MTASRPPNDRGSAAGSPADLDLERSPGDPEAFRAGKPQGQASGKSATPMTIKSPEKGGKSGPGQSRGPAKALRAETAKSARRTRAGDGPERLGRV